ncbi:MAG: bifunctional [glutamine synthetase] adenylyltransferase/[glutamine synthetase]-adenylyl-L-tyrosine phosphorylase [Proteobacteria bacterium]|nr:bifunctional [glutamine synthetase] adenylyltransferase/[glutamine synthetase]-adenylyl-L-tyrosine phosphorylase [Pseudomonadota bacterium]
MRKYFPENRQKSSAYWRELITEHSPYLSANLVHFKERPFDEVLKQSKKSLSQATDTDAVMSILRQAKKEVATLAAIADLKNEWDDITVMAKLSAFADFCMQHALKHLLQQAHKERKIRAVDTDHCGVSIIAVGKWGAYELNYSSDIDLMVIFDSQKSPVINQDETQSFFIRLTRDLARLFDQITADGYVFRTDLRLRPDPGAMPLAISLATAETYYSMLGQNWERAAMIKARPVAGDMSVGADFMKMIRSWIWRKNLDFATIQDIHSIKRQINAKQKKSGSAFNVKLGHGGIREIEFFVQTQQLVYGGREPQLQVPDTLSALRLLAETGHITGKTCDQLSDAYLFLRRTEHRLQMREDRQTHSLPADIEKFAQFMGYPSAKQFLRELEQRTAAVKSLYVGLFIESPSLAKTGNLVFTGIEDDPETLETLKKMGFQQPNKITSAIRGWHHGRYRAVRSERARQILTEMIPHLLKTLSETPHPDDAFIRFDQFLQRLPSGIPVFSMFLHNPQQMSLVAEIMGTAPVMAEYLGTHPEVLQGVLSKDYFGRLPELDSLTEELKELLATARDYEDVLDLARRFARDKRFHAGIHILQAMTPLRRVGRYLSDIAEACIISMLPLVEREFEKNHGKFKTGTLALLTMGSFAARSLSVNSDLDIVSIYDVNPKEKFSNGIKPLPPNVYYIRLMQRLLTALTAPTTEGVLYEVDTRLRPAGHDGPLAISLDGFIEYQQKQAWVWEHMSLTSSRVISLFDSIKDKLDQEIKSIITQKRDPEKLRHDVLEMRQKVKKQFGTKDPWDMKHRSGGMMDILFAAHYLILLHAHRYKSLPHPDVVTCLDNLVKKKVLAKNVGHQLMKNYLLAQGVQSFLRMTAELPFNPRQASSGLKTALARSVLKGEKNKNFQHLELQLNKLTGDLHRKIF